MKFEYDKRKSNSNKKKHGLDFEEAQELWNDRFIMSVPSSISASVESRFLYIGLIGSKHWTAITTYREPDLTRIISVRRFRKQEVELYES
jgi:uncharacterized DUF497 family protein